MKRDPDLVRSILVQFEALPDWLVDTDTLVEAANNPDDIMGHLIILEDAGLLAVHEQDGRPLGWRITWEGHEFLAKTSDPEVWSKAKSGAKKLGSFSMSLLGELATGYVKAKAAQLGIPISS